MANGDGGGGLLSAFGQGLQGAGAVLSSEVYQTQAQERQNALANIGRSLEIVKAKRQLDADTEFDQFTKGLQPSAMTSEGLLDVAKKIPINVLAESPRAQQFMQMTSQVQAREAAQQARRDALDARITQMQQTAEWHQTMAANTAFSNEERARHNLAMEQINRGILDLRRELGEKRQQGTLTDDAVTNEAWYQIINGKIRPGAVAWGVAGNPDRGKITNRITEIANEYGISPQKLASLGFTNKAKASALLALEKQRNAVGAYERSFISQVDVLEGLSQKVGRTGSPWINTPLNELRARGAGNPDVAEFLAQMRLVQTEAARIIANPNLVGQLTDTARREIQDILSGNMTPAQITRLTARLKADAELRKKGLDAQATQLGREIEGSTNPSASTTPPAAGGTAWSSDKEKRYQELLRKQRGAE